MRCLSIPTAAGLVFFAGLTLLLWPSMENTPPSLSRQIKQGHLFVFMLGSRSLRGATVQLALRYPADRGLPAIQETHRQLWKHK